MPVRKPEDIRVIVATDCGSTTTKAILIEEHEGEYRLIVRGEAPTTVEAPFEDVTMGVLNAISEVTDLTGRKLIDESGQIIRLRGQGLPNVNGYGRGDELIRVVIETPRHLTPRQEELLREFAKTEEKNVSPRRKSFFEKLKDYFEGKRG